MILFKCPACQKALKSLDEGAGSRISCPQCGQQMLVPAPVQPAALPAATNKSMLGQLAPSSAPRPASISKTPPAYTPSGNLVLLGHRKDADLERRSGERPDGKPARSWPGTLCGSLALALTVTAMPAAVIHHLLLGACLAAFGIALALLAAWKSLFRKGFGLATVAVMLGGSVLFSIVMLAGGPTALLQPVKDRLFAVSRQVVHRPRNGARCLLSPRMPRMPRRI